MPIKKKKPVLPIPMCESNGCDKPAVYGFRRIIYTTPLESIARDFIVDPFNCCEEHEEDVARDFSGPDVKMVNLKLESSQESF
jgi:hypothetical protein